MNLQGSLEELVLLLLVSNPFHLSWLQFPLGNFTLQPVEL